VTEFIQSENWPTNSPVDYSVWGALQQMMYHYKIFDINRLKHMPIAFCT